MGRKKVDASAFLLAVIVALLAVGGFAAVYTLRGDPIEDALTSSRVINTLFVFEDNKKPIGTYVLMYYPVTRRAAVIDIPGETGLLIARINRVDRIDRVYNPARISVFVDEIEGLLGIDISFSLVLTQENLVKAVDMIEGVELFIPFPVNIRGSDETVLFPSGVVRLDGDKAAMYVHYTSSDEEQDMTVFRRQRFFLGFLKRQGEMNNKLKNPAASGMYQSFFAADMNQRARIRLFDEFAGIDIDRTSIQSVGGNLREVSGQMLLIPSYDGSLVKEIVRQTLGSLTRETEGLFGDRVFTVEVLNGTETNGLAGRTAELLRGFGYDVISIGNADKANYERTEIVDRSGNENMAKAFAEIIRCENIRFETPLGDNTVEEFSLQTLEYQSDFTLIIGKDFNGRYVTGS